MPLDAKFANDYAFIIADAESDPNGDHGDINSALIMRATTSKARRDCILRIRAKCRSEEQLKKLRDEYLNDDERNVLEFTSTMTFESNVEDAAKFYREKLFN